MGLINVLQRLTWFQVHKVCTNCGVNMGEYFCEICKFYDDDVILNCLLKLCCFGGVDL